MARKRKDASSPSGIKLSQPDRTGPTEKTLLDWAQERDLFAEARRREADLKAKTTEGKQKKTTKQTAAEGDDTAEDAKEEEDDDTLMSPWEERVMEVLLWTVSVSMLYFTLDVLVQHQYAMELEWWPIVRRSVQSFFVFLFLMYTLHPHYSNPNPIPALPARFQEPVRQTLFFVTSVLAGCHLIYVTNTFGYIAVLKRAPALGCLWLWSVVELHLLPAVVSLAVAGGYLWYGGYDIK